MSSLLCPALLWSFPDDMAATGVLDDARVPRVVVVSSGSLRWPRPGLARADVEFRSGHVARLVPTLRNVSGHSHLFACFPSAAVAALVC